MKLLMQILTIEELAVWHRKYLLIDFNCTLFHNKGGGVSIHGYFLFHTIWFPVRFPFPLETKDRNALFKK